MFMDDTTKQILNKIKNSENQTIVSNGIDNPFEKIASEASAKASLNYLKNHNYIEITENLITTISVSYRTLHPDQYYLKKVLSYLLNNWISIVALIISIIALIKQ